MKKTINLRALRTVAVELKAFYWQHIEDLQRMLDEFRKVPYNIMTVEQFMTMKQKMMFHQTTLPLGPQFCYYCIDLSAENPLRTDGCDECEYGKIHGRCWERASHYNKLTLAWQNFRTALAGYYPQNSVAIKGKINMQAIHNAMKYLIEYYYHHITELQKNFDAFETIPYDIMTVDQLMTFKKETMFLQIKLPLDSEFCYFCVDLSILNLGCLHCQYAKVHGRCQDQKSTFKQIYFTRLALIRDLHSYHIENKYRKEAHHDTT